MSYGAGICDPGTSHAPWFCRSRAVEPEWRPRNRSSGVSGLPPIVEIVPCTLALALRRADGLRIPTYQDETGAQQEAYLEEQHQTRTMSATKDLRTMQRTFIIHGSYDPAQCQDMGPQPQEAFEDDATLIVEKRDCKPYAAGEGSGEYNMCLLVVDYRTRQLEGGKPEPLLEYQYGSESEHISQALAQFTTGPDDSGLDHGIARFGNSLNVSSQGVGGAEINAPIIDFSEEHVFTEEEFNSSYRYLLREHVQKTNSAAFREFGAFEVLFVGVTARKSVKTWNLTFSFRARRTVMVNVDVTSKDGKVSNISVPKPGWYYLWIEILQKEATDGNTKKKFLLSYPHSVSVAKVYEEVDFSILGIGTDPIP